MCAEVFNVSSWEVGVSGVTDSHSMGILQRELCVVYIEGLFLWNYPSKYKVVYGVFEQAEQSEH